MIAFPDEAWHGAGTLLLIGNYPYLALEDEAHSQNAVGHPESFAYLNCGEAAVASSLDYILYSTYPEAIFLLFAKKRKRNLFYIPAFCYILSLYVSEKPNIKIRHTRSTYLTKGEYNLLCRSILADMTGV